MGEEEGHRQVRGEEDLKRIVGLELGKLSKRIEESGLSLEVSEAARDLLVEKGYDPTFGARPLRRASTPAGNPS